MMKYKRGASDSNCFISAVKLIYRHTAVLQITLKDVLTKVAEFYTGRCTNFKRAATSVTNFSDPQWRNFYNSSWNILVACLQSLYDIALTFSLLNIVVGWIHVRMVLTISCTKPLWIAQISYFMERAKSFSLYQIVHFYGGAPCAARISSVCRAQQNSAELTAGILAALPEHQLADFSVMIPFLEMNITQEVKVKLEPIVQADHRV